LHSGRITRSPHPLTSQSTIQLTVTQDFTVNVLRNTFHAKHLAEERHNCSTTVSLISTLFDSITNNKDKVARFEVFLALGDGEELERVTSVELRVLSTTSLGVDGVDAGGHWGQGEKLRLLDDDTGALNDVDFHKVEERNRSLLLHEARESGANTAGDEGGGDRLMFGGGDLGGGGVGSALDPGVGHGTSKDTIAVRRSIALFSLVLASTLRTNDHAVSRREGDGRLFESSEHSVFGLLDGELISSEEVGIVSSFDLLHGCLGVEFEAVVEVTKEEDVVELRQEVSFVDTELEAVDDFLDVGVTHLGAFNTSGKLAGDEGEGGLEEAEGDTDTTLGTADLLVLSGLGRTFNASDLEEMLP